MIVKNRQWFRSLDQNTEDWLYARCGRVSASRAHDLLAQRPGGNAFLSIISPNALSDDISKNETWDKIVNYIAKKGKVPKSGLDKILGVSASPINTLIKKEILKSEEIKPKGLASLSGSAEKYMIQLVSELASGAPKEQTSAVIKAIDWGNQYESDARFEMMDHLDADISESGIILQYDDQRKSASVDGEINENEIVELKCPFSPERQMKNILNNGMEKEYYAQCQFQLMVSGAQVCHFGTFDPRYKCNHAEFRLFYKRIVRDEDYISQLKIASDHFVKILDEICAENKINRFLVECED